MVDTDNSCLTVDDCADRIVEYVLLLRVRGKDSVKGKCSWIFLALMSEKKSASCESQQRQQKVSKVGKKK